MTYSASQLPESQLAQRVQHPQPVPHPSPADPHEGSVRRAVQRNAAAREAFAMSAAELHAAHSRATRLPIPNRAASPAPPKTADVVSVSSNAASTTVGPEDYALWPHLTINKYKGESYAAFKNFLYDCESLFGFYPDATDALKVATAACRVTGSVKTSWVTHCRELGDEYQPSWVEFVAFLENHFGDAESREIIARVVLDNSYQEPGQSVQDFVNLYTELEAECDYDYEIPEKQRTMTLVSRLRPEIGDTILAQYRIHGISPNRQSAVGLARRIEMTMSASWRRGAATD